MVENWHFATCICILPLWQSTCFFVILYLVKHRLYHPLSTVGYTSYLGLLASVPWKIFEIVPTNLGFERVSVMVNWIKTLVCRHSPSVSFLQIALNTFSYIVNSIKLKWNVYAVCWEGRGVSPYHFLTFTDISVPWITTTQSSQTTWRLLLRRKPAVLHFGYCVITALRLSSLFHNG